MELESLIQYCDAYLDVPGHPDYRTALNGLQVGRSPGEPVARLAAAVDASAETIEAAAAVEADLLVVHHGLFWGGLEPVTGRRYRKLRALFDADLGLYSVHLPLDSHAEIGNCALLAAALEVDTDGRFGSYEGVELGWTGTVEPTDRATFRERVTEAVGGGPVQVLEGGSGRISRVAVLTGGGGSFLAEAAAAGVDALVTGEGSHHTYVDAMELGIDVFYAGHYATETFGVKALCAHLAERFELEWSFLDHPSGL